MQIQLQPEIEAQLAAEAQALSLTPEGYAEQLIAESITATPLYVREPELSMEEFDASLDRLTRYSNKIPALPIDAFSRESFYEGHD
jgi:hypothetical protein